MPLNCSPCYGTIEIINVFRGIRTFRKWNGSPPMPSFSPFPLSSSFPLFSCFSFLPFQGILPCHSEPVRESDECCKLLQWVWCKGKLR